MGLSFTILSMNITVFGASGKVGQRVVVELLSRGHTVTVFVRRLGRFTSSDTLRVIEGDIYQPETVLRAVVGADAVISTLGSWGSAKKDILTVGMRHIIPAMKASDVQRIVTLTGADARADGDQIGLMNQIMHRFLGIIASSILLDSEDHIRQLQHSALDWTVVRSPIMTNSIDVKFRLDSVRPMPWAMVSREAVAHAIVDCVERTDYSHRAPFVTRARR